MKNFDFNYLLRSSRALTIPAETLKKLERLFLSDLSGLRVCECSLPNDFIALASGTIVLIAPGFFRPGTMKGDAILAHEISHLFQQQSDPVTCSDENGVFIDRQLEIEADLWATLSIFSEGLAFELPRAYNHLPTENQGMVAQPWIKMAIETGDSPEKYGASDYNPALRFGGSYSDASGKFIDSKFRQLMDPGDANNKAKAAYKFLFGKEPPELFSTILYEWLGVTPGNVVLPATASYGERVSYKVRAEFRYYLAYGELAWAIKREIESRPALDMETDIAGLVLTNSLVRIQLESLATKVSGSEVLAKAKNTSDVYSLPATYKLLHGKKTFKLVIDALKAPDSCSFEDLIALLHDAKDVYEALGIVKGEESFVLHVRDKSKIIKSNKPSMRYNLSTPDEADDWVLEQRENGRPVWAGPSFTMAQIWRMAKIVNATNLEMEAMGYAMYSYWNKAYPKEGTPVHRFHGAMATSEEFGIKYNPDADVEKNYAGFQQRLRFIPSKL